MARGEFQRLFVWSVWITNLVSTRVRAQKSALGVRERAEERERGAAAEGTSTLTLPPKPPPSFSPPTNPKQLVNACFVLICWATADNLARMSGSLHVPAAAGGAAWSAAAQQTARAFLAGNAIWRAPIAACAIGGLMSTFFNVTSCLVLVRYETQGWLLFCLSFLMPASCQRSPAPRPPRQKKTPKNTQKNPPRKSMTSAAPGFAVGFVTAWSLVLAFTTLLVGLVLESFKSTVREHVDPAKAAGGGSDSGPIVDAATPTTITPPLAVPAGAQGWTRSMTGAYAASYSLAYACTALYALFFLVLLFFQKALAKSWAAPSLATRQQQEAMAVAGAGGGLAGLYSAQASAI